MCRWGSKWVQNTDRSTKQIETEVRGVFLYVHFCFSITPVAFLIIFVCVCVCCAEKEGGGHTLYVISHFHYIFFCISIIMVQSKPTESLMQSPCSHLTQDEMWEKYMYVCVFVCGQMATEPLQPSNNRPVTRGNFWLALWLDKASTEWIIPLCHILFGVQWGWQKM